MDFAEERERLEETLQDSPIGVDVGLRLYNLIHSLRLEGLQQNPYHLHGLCAIVGDPKEQEAILGPRTARDLFDGNSYSLYDDDRLALNNLRKGMDEDGAVWIGPGGEFLHCGHMIAVNPLAVFENPYAQQTFEYIRDEHKGGTRHIALIASSHLAPGLVYMTLRSEEPLISAFNNGRMIHSSYVDDLHNLEQRYAQAKPGVRTRVETEVGGLAA